MSAVVDRLRRLGLVAVVRASDPAVALAVARELVTGGVGAIEVTSTVPDAPAVLRQLADTGALLGAGTVTTSSQLDEMLDAGARFAVSPVAPRFLIPQAHEAGVPAVPGCATPTEVVAALGAGALAVKLFPAARLGGPAYLRDLAGPLPGVAVMPSGGIGVEDVADYRAAGAWCVGVGGPLVGPMTSAARREAAARAVAGAAAA